MDHLKNLNARNKPQAKTSVVITHIDKINISLSSRPEGRQLPMPIPIKFYFTVTPNVES